MRAFIAALKAEWGWRAATCYKQSGNSTAPNAVCGEREKSAKMKAPIKV